MLNPLVCSKGSFYRVWKHAETKYCLFWFSSVVPFGFYHQFPKKCVSEGFAKCTSSEVEETIKVVPGVVYCGKITLPILITGLYIASEFCLSCQVLCS